MILRDDNAEMLYAVEVDSVGQVTFADCWDLRFETEQTFGEQGCQSNTEALKCLLDSVAVAGRCMHKSLLAGSGAAEDCKVYAARATFALKVLTDHYGISADWALLLIEAGPGPDRDHLIAEMTTVAVPECAA